MFRTFLDKLRGEGATLHFLGFLLSKHVFKFVFLESLLFFNTTLHIFCIESDSVIRVILFFFDTHKVFLRDYNVGALILLIVESLHEFLVSLAEICLPLRVEVGLFFDSRCFYLLSRIVLKLVRLIIWHASF